MKTFRVALSILLTSTSALGYSIETLADGRQVRVPGRKPPPPSIESSNVHVIRRDREPGSKPKPKPTGGSLNEPNPMETTNIDARMCGLDTPSRENWEANHNEIIKWARDQFNDFLNNGKKDDNFPRHLRETWAPNAVDSAFFCDGIGQCSIATCLSLIEDDGNNHHDRQMALHLFEFFANYDHLYGSMDKLYGDAMNYILHRSDRLVDEFSSAKRIEAAKRAKYKKRRLVEQVIASLGLAANGAMAFIPGTPLVNGLATMKASSSFGVSLYLAIVGILKELDESPDFVDDLKENIHSDMNDMLQKTHKAILCEWNDLLVGLNDTKGRNIVDIMDKHGYLGPDKHLYNNMADHTGRVIMGSAINTLWQMDRSYFVWVDTPGGCEQEKTINKRGPTEYLICLPELPHYGFWFYQIDTYHEGDRKDAMVRGPTGFWLLNESTKYYDITLQDIARSSYYIHRKDMIKRINDKVDVDPMEIEEMMMQGLEKNNPGGGRLAGVFTIPLCRNPGGESISGVLDKNGQNYPCACGEFNWKHGIGYTVDKDETGRFLAQSGFMFSKDWAHWCDHKNDCSDVKDLDTWGYLNSLRKDGDPEIPGDVASFFDCDERRDSKAHPGYPEDDRRQ